MKKKISKSYLFNIISPTHIIFPNITLLIHSQRKINLTYFIPNLTFFFSTIKSQIYLIVSDFNSLMSCPRNRSCVSGFEPPPRSVTSSCGLSGAAINSQLNQKQTQATYLRGCNNLISNWLHRHLINTIQNFNKKNMNTCSMFRDQWFM